MITTSKLNDFLAVLDVLEISEESKENFKKSFLELEKFHEFVKEKLQISDEAAEARAKIYFEKQKDLLTENLTNEDLESEQDYIDAIIKNICIIYKKYTDFEGYTEDLTEPLYSMLKELYTLNLLN